MIKLKRLNMNSINFIKIDNYKEKIIN
ncbi:uncharacterized protein METZ01_LOCUS816 [marine metagenome]|uniref:Uncharacterized protein n=1 Tax=marine metagenome TaxID=408172 RepID=A0A381N030_9ZZZZ